jgi:Pilus assembly protein, PilO
VSLTARDRKILMLLIPVALVAAYWLLVLAPKRKEASSVRDQLTQAQSQRDTAQQQASQLSSAKRDYAADYATVIYLGKSIPSDVDMPSLVVQLDRAARGTGIDFADVKTGTRDSSSSASAPAPAPNGGSGPNAQGAAPAQSGAGKAAQSAGSAVNNSNNASGSTSTSTDATAPASSSTSGGGAANSPAGLDSVPLDFEFRGSFFSLADFFHRMKRFVRVANKQIIVRGRLITINSFSFDASTTFPQIDAKVHATVYLAPKSQGVSAGAAPQGPAGTAAAPAGQQASSASSPTPAATVTP